MSKMKLLIMMLVFALFIAGCGTKQAADTKAPAPQVVGIIDMNKTVKAHPQYNQLMILGQQADVMAAQLETQQLAAMHMASIPSIADMPKNQLDELNKAFDQEFNAKMSEKQDELSRRIAAQANTIGRALSDEMTIYNDQLDKEYQPQILNLQLKLKTLQLAKEETITLQAELEKLQAKRSDALATKQMQLAARMEEQLAPEKAAVEQQLATYAKELSEELSKQAAAKQEEIVGRVNEQRLPAAQTDPGLTQIQEQLAMKHEEIQALQGSIIAKITDKTAKVAVASGLETVLINVAVNVNAVDITTQVITECNK